jgi:hypothetical protein
LWGKTTIIGDNGNPRDPGDPWDGSGRDWSRINAWCDPSDLAGVTSIKLSLTDLQSNANHYGWGWGQEVFLVLSDGTNTAQALLVENHEQPYATPQPYTTSVGSDGRTWFDFDISLTPGNFPGLAGINKSSTMVGVCWEAESWHSSSQTLWTGCAVDDIQLVPEPSTLILLLTSGTLVLFLLHRRK